MVTAKGKTGGRIRGALRLLLTGLVLWGSVTAVRAEPTVAQMLGYRPRQDGVDYSTPTAETQAKCKVELFKGPRKGSGWLLKDADGQNLRLFFDTNDDKKIDVWAYFKDGIEVYREIDSTYSGRPDQFRWLNGGGMKWGLADANGKIKTWKAISPEEVSQEVIASLAKQDFARLHALLITEAEIKELNLPPKMAEQIVEKLKKAPARFQEVAPSLAIPPTAKWIHLETKAPHCLPADQNGTRYDLIEHSSGTILYDLTGKGEKSEIIQTGVMIQVGLAWRLVDVPFRGVNTEDVVNVKGSSSKETTNIDTENPQLLKLIKELDELDKTAPTTGPGVDPAVAKHHLKRADLLEKIIALVTPSGRENWIRQVVDSLSTAAQASPKGDSPAMTRLLSLENQLVEKMPGSNLAAYVTFREMQTDYSRKISDEKDFSRIQNDWLKRLGDYVQAYPKSEDTPDAMLQAGMVSEFLDKDVEAKNWYSQLKKSFADKPQGAKGEGCLRRLACEGQPFQLAAATLADSNVNFDIESTKNKITIVYYWAAWNSQSVGDFAKLKQLLDTYGKKGVELVCVNLDSKVDEAKEYLAKNPAPGTHLYQTGGLDSKLATQYGIMVLPHLFLVDRVGNVASRKVQIGNLDEELKKLIK